MRFTILAIISLLLIACGRNEKPQGINFRVTDKGDTLSHFYYQGSERYFFYSNEEIMDLKIKKKDIFSKIPGEFVFGLRNSIDSMNRFYFFRAVQGSTLLTSDKPWVPFLDEEFKIASDHRVVVCENYVDTTLNPIRKIEIQVAIENETNDTIVFQELDYFMKGNDFFTALFAYEKREKRDEMRALLDDAVKTMKESIKDAGKKDSGLRQ